MTVGEAMRAAREAAGLTQAALAAITGISPTSLNQYEKDKYLPRVDTAEMLADTLGISIDEYVGHGAGENYKPDVEALARAQQLKTAMRVKGIADKLTRLIADFIKEEMAVDLNE